jgi:hypothetical protein
VNIARRIIKAASIAALFCVALAGTAVAALTHPQPLFPYHVAHGRLSLYSDRPFDATRAGELLADVERRLSRSSLNDGNEHRIFISNSQWRRRILFLWNSGAAGMNYYPLTPNVFVARADVDGDRVMMSSGQPKSPPRTLGYYAAHEIAHTLIKQGLAPLRQLKLPRWINEGLADDIGFGDDADIEGLALRLQAGDPDLDPVRSGHYDRYRLLVRYVMKRKGWTASDLVASFMQQSEAEGMLKTDLERVR